MQTILIKTCKTFLFLLSLTFAADVAYQYYKRKKKKDFQKEINEVIIFSYGVGELKKSKHSRCMITVSLDRLLYYLNCPRHTLDICMFVMTNLDIANALMKLHHRGVAIRIIVDADMAFSAGSFVRRLEKHGIPVRWMKSTHLMHHKFCLIDATTDNTKILPFVINGSLNWTNQALSGNWENVVVTSQKELVEQFRVEFERLWICFKPIVE